MVAGISEKSSQVCASLLFIKKLLPSTITQGHTPPQAQGAQAVSRHPDTPPDTSPSNLKHTQQAPRTATHSIQEK